LHGLTDGLGLAGIVIDVDGDCKPGSDPLAGRQLDGVPSCESAAVSNWYYDAITDSVGHANCD